MDRQGEDQEPGEVPMHRLPVRGIAWGIGGALFVCGSVYFGGPVWGVAFGVAVCITVLIAISRWAPRGAPAIGRRLAAWTATRPAIATSLAVIIAVSGLGACVRYLLVDRDTSLCMDGIRTARMGLERGDMSVARTGVGSAKPYCDESHRGELAALDRQIAAIAEAAEKERARQDAEHQAVSDRAAIASFPERAAAARALLKSATSMVAKNELPAATAEFTRADAILREFKGTSVEKTTEYIAIRGEADKVLQAVRPYIAEVEAAVLEMKRQIDAQAEQDRRDGVKLTKEGYVAAGSREKMDQAIRYASAKDMEGFKLLLENDPEVTLMKANVRVVVIERVGIVSPVVRVRIRGTLNEFWTVPDALRDP